MTSSAAPQASGNGPASSPGWRSAWIFVGFCALFLFARDLAATRFGSDFSIAGAALWGRDFVNVYTSGALVNAGRVDILYDVPAYQAYQLELFGASLNAHNYSYPPVTLLYTWLFALLPYPVALFVWLGGTGALFWRAARPYLGDVGLPAWVALIAPASLVNLWAGHYGFLIGALWLGAWSVLPRRPALAGVLIGLMVVKPHLAVLAPLVLLWRREWTAIAAAALTVVATVGLSLILFGPALWATYLTDTAIVQAAMVDDVGAFFLSMMPTLMPALAVLGVPVAVAGIVQALAAAAAVAALLKWLPSDSRKAGLAAATATFLVLPYAFSYDMTAAGLAGMILLRASITGRPRWFVAAAALAALVPMLILYLNLFYLPVGPLLIAFQLAALLGWRPAPR
jgi:alpha-1,2-mannosyltransferase